MFGKILTRKNLLIVNANNLHRLKSGSFYFYQFWVLIFHYASKEETNEPAEGQRQGQVRAWLYSRLSQETPAPEPELIQLASDSKRQAGDGNLNRVYLGQMFCPLGLIPHQ